MAEVTFVTQAGLNVIANADADIRLTQVGLNVLAKPAAGASGNLASGKLIQGVLKGRLVA